MAHAAGYVFVNKYFSEATENAVSVQLSLHEGIFELIVVLSGSGDDEKHTKRYGSSNREVKLDERQFEEMGQREAKKHEDVYRFSGLVQEQDCGHKSLQRGTKSERSYGNAQPTQSVTKIVYIFFFNFPYQEFSSLI